MGFGGAMASARMQADAVGHLEMLRRITACMALGRDVAEVLSAITDTLVTIAEAALVRIWLAAKSEDCLVCQHRSASRPRQSRISLHLAASAGLYSHIDGASHRVEIGSRKVGEIADSREAIWTNDLMSDPRIVDKRWAHDNQLVSFAGYPLVFRSELVGVLGMFSRRRLDAEHFQSFEVFATQAATAIKTARLFTEVEQLKDRLLVENRYLQDEARVDAELGEIIGVSAAIQRVLQDVRAAGPIDAPVLLTGETGTGKELVARALHALSPRRERPMIRVNCGAIPPTLIESEFFGHERGAFTGAVARRLGRFELADRSTLFLDEIGELPPTAQVALLRALEDGEFERVGAGRPIRVDVRTVAATNRDLAAEIGARRFREDLFYRLNVFPIRIPPLRERLEDIPHLVAHLLERLQRKLAKPLRRLSSESIDRLIAYPWPGNVRELQNVVERACILARGPVVDVPVLLLQPSGAQAPAGSATVTTLEDAERAAIVGALKAAGGRVAGPKGAATLLAVNPSTLRSRMAQLGIRRLSVVS
jgi:formate hydrogenlyase transcriptional activator